MSNVLNVVKSRHARLEFKMLIVFAFCLVAMSFFVVGFIYAQAPDIAILLQLLVTIGMVNIAMVFYVIKKFNAISNA